ncbi:MAG: glycosyltransferase, partial [Rhodothermales bacterium]|nr:glycosyltransferase [Rhodothermales bacterium]
MRILVHDYAGHPFQVQLSRELASRGHTVLHAFASQLQTPRGLLSPTENDSPTLSMAAVPMDPSYTAKKYSFVRRRQLEVKYGVEAGRLVENWQPDVVLSGNTPTESQSSIIRSSRRANAKFVYWVQDFYSLAVDRLARKKIPLLGSAVGNWYKRLDKAHFAQSDAVIAITEDFFPILTERFGVDSGKIHSIPNWGPLQDIDVVSKQNDWSTANGLDSKFCFMYTGTLGMK